ncbi:hypothetical protein KFE25_000793 [Diacronema lutheri]|uniref:NAD(+) diphosphatase n=2 Tax=Diacronema lutheri TaxID=2081491 RepID=A0A8J5XS93_DIALT|nr:hypothetical protein KFE25_000793 [Diacronema lutheri]
MFTALSLALSSSVAKAPGALRPWFSHGTSLTRDRALLHPLNDCLKRGVFIPVTSSVKSFTNAGRSLIALTHANLPEGHLDRAEWVWIGRRSSCGTDVFAVAMEEPEVRAALARAPPASGAADAMRCDGLRDVADTIECADEAAILSSARGFMHFHATNRFCARCGTPTAPTKAGAARLCTNAACAHKVYPRVDPAAIVLVTSPRSVDGGRHALLGRKKIWPRGRFSTLAGFADLGETIEEALCREVHEESGVTVRPSSLRFACSQPWLFPQSMMLGFIAEAEPSAADPRALPRVSVDEHELEACEWFDRDFVRARLDIGAVSLTADTSGTAAADFHVPGRVSLANVLITHWATSQCDSAQ